jgi:hypothetical protein
MKHLPLKECGYAIAGVVVLLVLYGGAYLALSTKTEFGWGESHSFVEYRCGGEWSVSFFAPAHEIDRLLRPDFWRGDLSLEASRSWRPLYQRENGRLREGAP